ncbi:MAG: hypothetical protein J0H08_06350 [Rhizobiales bacterium]|nr:hypothetical protein [Hyphomicrobiales bacterium]
MSDITILLSGVFFLAPVEREMQEIRTVSPIGFVALSVFPFHAPAAHASRA